MIFPYEEIKNALLLPDLYLEVEPSMGSNNANHRSLIRQRICRHLENQNATFGKNDIEDLSKVPSLETGDVSISHNPELGGFALTLMTNTKIGFDIEMESRVQPKVVQRVLNNREKSLGLPEGLLWVCKEASFKAVANNNPQVKVLSHTRVSQIMPLKFNIWIVKVSYKGCGNGSIHGIAGTINSCFYSIFKYIP